jgi:hypothetical protein
LERTRHERASLLSNLGEPLKRNVGWLLALRYESMPRAFLVLIVLSALLSGGCSFGTDYVIVNSSPENVTVIYTIAPTTIDPLVAADVPAIASLSQMAKREWRKLSDTEFLFDRANRTVTVSLPQNQGLRITRGGDYSPTPPIARKFIIEEIRIKGSNGEMSLRGDAVPRAFVVVPKSFFSFGPPTLLKLTYR